jgi:hypothetical protein
MLHHPVFVHAISMACHARLGLECDGAMRPPSLARYEGDRRPVGSTSGPCAQGFERRNNGIGAEQRFTSRRPAVAFDMRVYGHFLQGGGLIFRTATPVGIELT